MAKRGIISRWRAERRVRRQVRRYADGLVTRGMWPGDDPRWERMFGNYAEPVAAGVDVDEDTALTIAAVFAAVRVLAETIASLPLPVYRRLTPRGKERNRTHPLYALLHDAPNEEMSSFSWREATMSHVLLWGNGHSYIQRTGDGQQIKALLPLNPTRVKVKRRDTTNAVYYEYYDNDGTMHEIAQRDMFHLHGLGFNGLTGYSVVSKARESFGLGMAAERHGAAFFGNGAHFSGIFEYPTTFEDEAARKRFRRDWNAMYKGPAKAGKPLILEQGMKWTQTSMSNDDAQFLETRKFQVSEVARWFRIPPHMLGDLEKATFSNIEHQGIDFVVHSLRPWLVRFEAEIQRKLFAESERNIYFAEFLVDGLLRGDTKSRMEAYKVGLQNGVYSLDEVRELENLNPLDEGGDVHFVPLNMQTLEQAVKEPEPQPDFTPVDDDDKPDEDMPQPADDDADDDEESKRLHSLTDIFGGLFADAAQRILRKETKRVHEAGLRFLGKQDRAGFTEWLDTFYRDHRGAVIAALTPIADSLAQALDLNGTSGVRMTEYLDATSKRYVASAIDQIRAQTDGSEALAELELLLTEWLQDDTIERMGRDEAVYAIATLGE